MVELTGKFQWSDYLIFSLSCAMTVVIGLGFAIKDKWGSQSTESYLMGDRNMSWVMVGISAFASVVSAVLFVGPLAELYYMGLQFIWIIPGMVLGTAVTAFVIIPKYFRMGVKVTSAYEYFEIRFNLPVRMLASGIYSTCTLLYMGVVLYAPCLILAQVSDLSIGWCIVIGAAVCLIYTGFGGMKAVVWVDNVQTLIMAVGLIVLAIKGTIDAGGIQKTWEVYKTTGRAEALDMDMRPWDRHNVMNLLFFVAISHAAVTGSQQLVMQRFLAVKSMRHAQAAAFASVVLFPVFYIFVVMVAIAAFAQLGGHEPLLTKEIEKPGQIFPYYMMHVLGHIPGLPGLLTAASFAAALSSLSSGQNSLAAVILEDFVKPVYKKRHGKPLSEAAAGKISRLSGVALGFVIMGLGLAVMNADDMVFSLVRSLESFVTGPIFSLLIMAMFIPFVESWGALIGTISSLLWGIQIYIGTLTSNNKIGYDMKPLYLKNFTTEIPITPPDVEPTLYDVSYLWYVPMDLVVGVVVGCSVSLVVLFCKHRAALKVNRDARWSDGMTGRGFGYRKDDFLAAFGIRKCFKVKPLDNNLMTLTTSEKLEAEEKALKAPLQQIAVIESGLNVSDNIKLNPNESVGGASPNSNLDQV